MKHFPVLALVIGLCVVQKVQASDVAIFGTLDMTWVQSSAGPMKRTAIESGGRDMSMLAFRADEDLGNGNKAGMLLEYGLSPDTNSGVGASQFGTRMLARSQYVYLSGDYGLLLVGRVGSTLNQLKQHDAGIGSVFSPLLSTLAPTVNYRADFTSLNNAVRYSSPTFRGVSVTVAYSFAPFSSDNTAYSNEQERATGLAIHYREGGFSSVLVYQHTDHRALTPTIDLSDVGLGMTYDFGGFKLLGSVLATRRSGPTGPHSMDQWTFGATVPAGTNGLVRAEIGGVHDKTLAQSDAHSWMLGYDYALSKRTTLYVISNHTRNESAASYAADPYNRPLAGNSARVTGLGFRHTF